MLPEAKKGIIWGVLFNRNLVDNSSLLLSKFII
jgi:hypothetical protein